MRGSTAYLLESFGVCFELVLPFPLDRVRSVLPPGVRRGAATAVVGRRFVLERQGRRYRVLVDARAVSDSISLGDARDLLEGEIALHVAASAPRHVFIHAGVVVWRGRALVLPGRSLAGKSTLVKHLVEKGARYYSDEYAVLNDAGKVLAYPRRLSLRRAHGTPRKITMPQPRPSAIDVGWVVGTQFSPAEKGGFVGEQLTAGQTALLLLDNAVAARISPGRVLPAVRAAAARAEGLRGTRGEAKITAPALLARCNGPVRVVPGKPDSRRLS